MIHHYRLLVQYKGTVYSGWQVQPESAGPTIQGELNRALAVVAKSSEVRSMGAGRTDAGVHALGQIAKVSIPLQIDPDNLRKAINVNLPDDIRILAAELSDEAFMPTVHAVSKEYEYRFTCTRSFTAFQNDLIVNHPFELDIELMNQACEQLVGTHDFLNFFCEGTDVSSTVRTIFDAKIVRVEQGAWSMLPAHYAFQICGSGFLKQMVRLLMGALWNVGRGKLPVNDFVSALKAPARARLGPVAPPEGLYMVRVNY